VVADGGTLIDVVDSLVAELRSASPLPRGLPSAAAATDGQPA
jgi:hypothetical protein